MLLKKIGITASLVLGSARLPAVPASGRAGLGASGQAPRRPGHGDHSRSRSRHGPERRLDQRPLGTPQTFPFVPTSVGKNSPSLTSPRDPFPVF